MEDNTMDGVCRNHGRYGNTIHKFRRFNWRMRKTWENYESRWILKGKVGTMWNIFNWLKRRKNNRIYITRKKLSGTTKGGEFFDKLNDYQLYGINQFHIMRIYIWYQYKTFKCLSRMKIILAVKWSSGKRIIDEIVYSWDLVPWVAHKLNSGRET